MTLRVGQGYDAHAFAPISERRPLILGGVQIAPAGGLAGHSDADVLTHAIADALLGAARLGDIGQYFPDDDPTWQNADSQDLLRRVAALLEQQGYKILDIDSVIVAEKPRMSPWYTTMREQLAATLQLPVNAVGVKATSTDGLGAIGRGEGIAASAVALLEIGDELAAANRIAREPGGFSH
ncbi:MAG: 2-C-methyl-D-erythritol 2,4-cyclodiphosphate synthase [Actinomycetia bacterium]|nr:2-C-methyl-D-erythritol 2,4-cyclodiphosphate synthase [Actinomycetes bacterium]